MPMLVHYLVLSVLEYSLIGGRVLFSLSDGEGGGGGGIENMGELANTV